MKVEHCLMALPGAALEDIQTVYSHEQGLSSAEKYLDATGAGGGCPRWTPPARPSRWPKAATAPPPPSAPGRAAQIYGLHILAEGVNYNAMNHTRFVVVSPVLELRPGRNKISAVFRLPHQSGSLHEILTVFAVQGLNLLKIESRAHPRPGLGIPVLPGLYWRSRRPGDGRRAPRAGATGRRVPYPGELPGV